MRLISFSSAAIRVPSKTIQTSELKLGNNPVTNTKPSGQAGAYRPSTCSDVSEVLDEARTRAGRGDQLDEGRSGVSQRRVDDDDVDVAVALPARRLVARR